MEVHVLASSSKGNVAGIAIEALNQEYSLLTSTSTR